MASVNGSGSGLGALRAAALSSKKRKRTPEEGEELEEGEISDDPSPPKFATEKASVSKPAGAYNPFGVVPTGPRKLPDKPQKSSASIAAVVPALVTEKSVPPPAVPLAPRGNRLPPPPPVAVRQTQPPLFTAQVALREPCRDLIKELVSWGVTPEYLVGYGIAKETIALAFVELGYRLPHGLVYLAEPAAQALKTALENPPPAAPPAAHRQLPQRPAASTVEQARIEEVLAKQPPLSELEQQRREQLAARRKERVAVEASIDTLFASANGFDSEDEDVKPNIGQLRSAVMGNDELVPMPSTGPFDHGRPHAYDFEEPTSRTNGFMPPIELLQPQQLLLDLSDEEMDEDDTEVAAALAPRPNGLESVVASPDARKKLSEKEAEIKRMTAMIEKLEKKNKRGKAKLAEESEPEKALEPALPSAQLQEAKDKMEQLVDERQEIIAAAVADQADAEGRMQVEERVNRPPLSCSTVHNSQPSVEDYATPGYVAVDFTSYSSPFYDYSESRNTPPPSVFVAPRVSLYAWTANHRDIEYKRKLCHFESEGGVCNDPDCRNVHFNSFEPRDGDIGAWLKTIFRLPANAAHEHVQVLQRGLDVLLGRFASPIPTLDLDSLYAEAHVFLRQMRPALS